MKAVISAFAIVILMIGAPLAYAQVGSTASMTSTEPGQLSELPHSHHPEAAYRSGFARLFNASQNINSVSMQQV